MTVEKLADASVAVYGDDFFVPDVQTTAFIVIDMQDCFLRSGAPYETADARAFLPALEEVIIYARAANAPVIWTQSDHCYPQAGILLKKFTAVRQEGLLCQGDPGYEIYAEMCQPLASEGRVVKHKYDAFFETDLDAILRNLGVKTVVLMGTATNVCCESTARSAFNHDYQVVVLSNVTASYDRDMHDAALRNIETFFGRVMTSTELFRTLDRNEHRVSAGAPA